MLSRCLALLFIPVLPFVPFMAPLGHAHAINALVAGTLAIALALFALVDDRARFGAAIVGGWVAFSPFIFGATLLEQVIALSWGVSTFVFMAGPFSAPARTYRTPASVRASEPAAASAAEQHLPFAA